MSLSVCASLSAPDSNGNQNCLVWVDYPSLLPSITYVQANQIGLAFMGVFAVVFVINLIKAQVR